MYILNCTLYYQVYYFVVHMAVFVHHTLKCKLEVFVHHTLNIELKMAAANQACFLQIAYMLSPEAPPVTIATLPLNLLAAAVE